MHVDPQHLRPSKADFFKVTIYGNDIPQERLSGFVIVVRRTFVRAAILFMTLRWAFR
jgi:hypothetical protein